MVVEHQASVTSGIALTKVKNDGIQAHSILYIFHMVIERAKEMIYNIIQITMILSTTGLQLMRHTHFIYKYTVNIIFDTHFQTTYWGYALRG